MANKNILIVIEREHKIKQSTAHKMKKHEVILLDARQFRRKQELRLHVYL